MKQIHTRVSSAGVALFMLFFTQAQPALAQQPSISGVSGSMTQGSLMTITGSSLNAERMQGWDSRFVRIPTAWSFEGSSPTADGYAIPGDNSGGVYDSSVKLLGLTVDSPHLGVAFVTSEGVRCEIDKNVQGADQLAPEVSREVNRRLRERARKKLERRQGVPFGCISLSEAGVTIQELPPKSWWEKLRHRFESNVDTSVVVPGEYAWHDVADIRVVSAVRGDRMSDRTTYNQLQIRVQGRKSPVCSWAVPEFPNFTVFCEVLEQLGRPLTHGK